MAMIDKIEAILKRELEEEDKCKWCVSNEPYIICTECAREFKDEMYHEVAVMITQEVMEDAWL